jgi:hypothetical protein
VKGGKFEMGDQRVSWEVYRGESIGVCAKQEKKKGAYQLVEASDESGGIDLMTVDYDIVEVGTTMTKNRCIELISKKNAANLSQMRTICFFLIVFACCFCFVDFAVLFDMFTDAITFIPQLIGETVACGGDCISDQIQGLEDAVDGMAYCCCSCVGCCVGLISFLFIFAFCYVSARAGYAWLFYLSIALFILLIFGCVYFSKRMMDKNAEVSDKKSSMPQQASPNPQQPNQYQQPVQYQQAQYQQPAQYQQLDYQHPTQYQQNLQGFMRKQYQGPHQNYMYMTPQQNQYFP